MKRLIILFLLLVYCVGCVENNQSNNIVNNSVATEYSSVVKLAMEHLSERLKIPVEHIQLVKEEAVDWPDTSLGIREEGMMYAQVITPGFRIILKADNKLYEYHSDQERIAGPIEI